MAENHLPLELDVSGRVSRMRLAPSKALLALYEAVVNSIHAILDGAEPTKGKIEIHVIRGSERQTTLDGGINLGSVVGFEIRDNGVGFDEKNFLSFLRTDNVFKAKYGGKGLGRLLWLKVFQNVTISSVFRDRKVYRKREFAFSTNGIGNLHVYQTSEPLGTSVTISNPVEHYRESLQKTPDEISSSIIEHCLEYMIQKKKPRIFLKDIQANYDVDLGTLLHDELKSDIKRDTFQINAKKFAIIHLLLRGRRNARHVIHFCANSRRVRGESLNGKIPGLAGAIRAPDIPEGLVYQGYITGAFLDEWVNDSRTGFDFDGIYSFDPVEPIDGGINYQSILNESIIKAKLFLDPTLKPMLEANLERIATKIEGQYPHYRHLLKHRRDEVAAVPTNVEGRELDFALYKIENKFDSDSREALHQELAKASDPNEEPHERVLRLNALMGQMNDSGMSKLARHVLYRREVIEFLEDQIGLQSTGKYSLEDAIHAAVCPTKVSSDDIPSSKMNLWLLDDRFYFHYYLASDMAFSTMKETVKRESDDRPDLAIFHRPMAFSDSLDQISAVVLVEFKRPMRDDFKDGDPEKNPVDQVLKYAKILRAGDGIGSKGQAIHIHHNTPFYAYIVADIRKSLREILIGRDFTITPDGDGFFYFHRQHNCYIEVISFQKMIRDAKKRNQAFFDRLNMPLIG